MYRCAEKSLGRLVLVENGVRLLSGRQGAVASARGEGKGEYRTEDGEDGLLGLGLKDREDTCGLCQGRRGDVSGVVMWRIKSRGERLGLSARGPCVAVLLFRGLPGGPL